MLVNDFWLYGSCARTNEQLGGCECVDCTLGRIQLATEEQQSEELRGGRNARLVRYINWLGVLLVVVLAVIIVLRIWPNVLYYIPGLRDLVN